MARSRQRGGREPGLWCVSMVMVPFLVGDSLSRE
jgi:hypothetical protein